jgi:hypothetical protein
VATPTVLPGEFFRQPLRQTPEHVRGSAAVMTLSRRTAGVR